MIKKELTYIIFCILLSFTYSIANVDFEFKNKIYEIIKTDSEEKAIKLFHELNFKNIENSLDILVKLNKYLEKNNKHFIIQSEIQTKFYLLNLNKNNNSNKNNKKLLYSTSTSVNTNKYNNIINNINIYNKQFNKNHQRYLFIYEHFTEAQNPDGSYMIPGYGSTLYSIRSKILNDKNISKDELLKLINEYQKLSDNVVYRREKFKKPRERRK